MGSLEGKRALVTGVSRRIGIGYAIVQRLASEGAAVVAHSWEPHDAEQPWGADPLGADGVIDALHAELPDNAGTIEPAAADLGDPAAPQKLIESARKKLGGPIDIVVANHARSADGELSEITADELDHCWAVNTRATILLAQAFVGQLDLAPGGRFVAFTSGQHHTPMPTEIPYAVSKAALAGSTLTLAAAVAPYGVCLNTIDPGPTDTGYADEELREAVRARIPFRRWGQPEDVANLVAFLVGPDGGWVTGQLIASDGGWMLRTGVPPAENENS